MTRFFSRALSVLQRIYRFEGGQILLNQLDMAAQVQPVHDVAREAELGYIQTDREAGGLFMFGQTNTHAAGNTQTNVFSPYQALDSSWGISGERWVWLLHWGATATDADITFAGLTANIAALNNALLRRDFLLDGWDSFSSGFIGTDLTFDRAMLSTGYIAGGASSSYNPPRVFTPFPLPPGSTLTFKSISSAASSCRCDCIGWVGPTGVYPPGMF